jgi:hypothetical protein
MCVVYYIYLRPPEKGYLIQNTSTAPTRAQVSSYMTIDGKNFCRNASPNITWGQMEKQITCSKIS